MSAESRFRRVWRWIKDEGNRSTMAFLGTAIVASSAAVVGGYEHFLALASGYSNCSGADSGHACGHAGTIAKSTEMIRYFAEVKTG